MRVVAYFFFAIALATASFDLIGILPVGGGNLRVTNLAMIGLSILGLLLIPRGVPRVHGFVWLLVWTIANAICVSNAPQNFRTYAYLIWLCVDVVFIYSMAVLFTGDTSTRNVARLNFYIYALIAGAGLLQFFLFTGGINILVAQSWTAGFPRINGFSYEPSYYATYLIVGWAMTLYLVLTPQAFIRVPILWIVLGLETVAMVLCTSRMGYLGMMLMIVFMIPKIARRLIASGAHSMALMVGGGAGVVAALIAFSIGTIKSDEYLFLLEGTGIAGTATHSRDARLEEFELYKDLFLSNPLKGYSLGGITGVLAGAGDGESVDYDELRQSQGINVSFEVILAGGLLAAPFFFLYLYKITIGSLRRLFQESDESLVVITKANIWGLLLQFFLLQFNQNILRNYFWIQIAIVSCLVTELWRQRRSVEEVP